VGNREERWIVCGMMVVASSSKEMLKSDIENPTKYIKSLNVGPQATPGLPWRLDQLSASAKLNTQAQRSGKDYC
jgi:hypothetical protein